MSEYQSIYDEEMRRRKVQDALLQQAMTPQGTQYAGNRAVPYSPWQGLTTLGQALIARNARESGDERIDEARQRQEAKRKAMADAVMSMYRGTPGTPAVTAPLLGPPELPDGQREISPAVPAVPPNPQEAMLLAASNPETEKMASIISGLDKSKEGSRGQYFTPEQVFTDDGRIVTRILNRRTGELMTLGDSEPVSSADPKARAAVKSAETTAKAEASRAFGMTGIGETIDEARAILKTGKPTGSGIGQAVDWMARQVGVSSESSQQAAQLEAIGGALTSKMPRMEGPQSDFDRINYEKMAAKVGDRGIPVEERLAALDSMEKIWRKYENLNPSAAPKGKPPTDIEPKLWDIMTPEEKALFE